MFQVSELEFVPVSPLQTAVLFLVFNRLDTTKKVFEQIRIAKPPRLYIAADGARDTKENESDIVEAVREYVLSNVDWDCEVNTFFRGENLGAKYAVSSAIDWFFKHEEMGIILEDDCLPSQSFFWYCEELLLKYKEHESVGAISGDLRGLNRCYVNDSSYDFSIYFSMWGWATWRRVWEQYNVEALANAKDDSSVQNVLNSMNFQKRTNLFWKERFKSVQLNKVDAWDYQFIYLLFSRQYLTIVPEVNLVSNIGFGVGATHTVDKSSNHANVAKHEIKFPLMGKKGLFPNKRIDAWYEINEYRELNILDRVIRKFRNTLTSIVKK